MNKLEKMINEEIDRVLNQKRQYKKTRALVENMVRKALARKLKESKGDSDDSNDEEDYERRKENEKKGNFYHDNKFMKKSGNKASQVRDILKDPQINLSALAREIPGLSTNDDTRRSEISKIARGEWTPDTSIQNDILHAATTD